MTHDAYENEPDELVDWFIALDEMERDRLDLRLAQLIGKVLGG